MDSRLEKFPSRPASRIVSLPRGFAADVAEAKLTTEQFPLRRKRDSFDLGLLLRLRDLQRLAALQVPDHGPQRAAGDDRGRQVAIAAVKHEAAHVDRVGTLGQDESLQMPFSCHHLSHSSLSGPNDCPVIARRDSAMFSRNMADL